MSQLGLGVMISRLGGTKNTIDEYYGETIAKAQFGEDKLKLYFESGKAIKIIDDGQSCCETRYMSSDDKADDLVGQKLTQVTVKEGPARGSGHGDHETCFVEIQAGSECFTFCTHNEHNGYYGGFSLQVREI